MDIKHVLVVQPAAARPTADAPRPRRARRAAPLRWIDVDAGGVVAVGHDGDGFAFDNEGPRHDVLLAAVRARRPPRHQRRVAGVHRRRRLPAARAVAVRRLGHRAAPRAGTRRSYWEPRRRRLVGVHARAARGRSTRPSRSCHVSYYEADAFARWAGARLPTEAEWEVGRRAPRRRRRRSAGTSCACTPAAGRAAGRRSRQLVGDVWEWTASAYLPYPGFRPPPGAVGEYNGKFMVQPAWCCGAAPASPRRATPGRRYRNFFPPAARWAFSGLRLAADA